MLYKNSGGGSIQKNEFSTPELSSHYGGNRFLTANINFLFFSLSVYRVKFWRLLFECAQIIKEYKRQICEGIARSGRFQSSLEYFMSPPLQALQSQFIVVVGRALSSIANLCGAKVSSLTSSSHSLQLPFTSHCSVYRQNQFLYAVYCSFLSDERSECTSEFFLPLLCCFSVS